MGRITHLTDERLVNMCVDGASTSGERAHLEDCGDCRARRVEMDRLLGEVTEAAVADTDAVFTPARLAVQQARILQRIAQDGRPARVIAFPAAPAADARLFRARPAVRWIAVAAAAGLAVGLVVGRLTHDLRGVRALRAPAAHAVSARLDPGSNFAPATLIVSDDELLGQIENASAGPVPVLRSIHELTPLADQAMALEH
jgi:hypothetical protein